MADAGEFMRVGGGFEFNSAVLAEYLQDSLPPICTVSQGRHGIIQVLGQLNNPEVYVKLRPDLSVSIQAFSSPLRGAEKVLQLKFANEFEAMGIIYSLVLERLDGVRRV